MAQKQFKAHKYRFITSMEPPLKGQLFLKGDIFYIYETVEGCFIVIDINRQFIFDQPLAMDNPIIQNFINVGELLETLIQYEP